MGSIILSLGTGGGTLLTGLLFGWLQGKRPEIPVTSPAALEIMKDLGLAAFVARIGLSSGKQALTLVSQYGFVLPLAGRTIALVPALISLTVSHFLLKLELPILLGGIAGQQCSTPALSAVQAAVGNTTSLIGYTITYAISNVILPLLGPIVVGLAHAGYTLTSSDKTDFVYMSVGLVSGLLIGKVVFYAGDIPVTLGSAGGALVSGPLFGWFRERHLNTGSLPDGAAKLLMDLGLSGFVAAIGLNYGKFMVDAVQTHGPNLFIAGTLVTVVPLVITMLVGRYFLHFDNAAVLAGALAGSRSASPAFGEALNRAENSVPTVPFAITYAFANVFLTLLGPLVVFFA